MGGTGSIHERAEIQTKFQIENVKRKDNFTDLGVYGSMIFKWILKKWGRLASKPTSTGG
jgi:hypothetical protein